MNGFHLINPMLEINIRQSARHKKRKMNAILLFIIYNSSQIKQNLINLLDRFDCNGESSPSIASECCPSRRLELEISSFGTTQTNSAKYFCNFNPKHLRFAFVYGRDV